MLLEEGSSCQKFRLTALLPLVLWPERVTSGGVLFVPVGFQLLKSSNLKSSVGQEETQGNSPPSFPGPEVPGQLPPPCLPESLGMLPRGTPGRSSLALHLSEQKVPGPSLTYFSSLLFRAGYSY